MYKITFKDEEVVVDNYTEVITFFEKFKDIVDTNKIMIEKL